MLRRTVRLTTSPQRAETAGSTRSLPSVRSRGLKQQRRGREWPRIGEMGAGWVPGWGTASGAFLPSLARPQVRGPYRPQQCRAGPAPGRIRAAHAGGRLQSVASF